MLESARRKLRIAFRKKREVISKKMTPCDSETLRFYQLKQKTSEFFYHHIGHCNVSIVDTPHYAFAEALHGGNTEKIAAAKEFYSRYLLSSWGSDASTKSIDAKIYEFNQLFFDIQKNGLMKPPILTHLRSDRPAYIVDGNHRVAIATALRISFSAEIWPLSLAFLKFNRIPEFYGSGNLDLPYQGLFVSGTEVISGRRNDLEERLSLIPKEAIIGQDLLDVASNVGVSSLLAHSMGAKRCVGVEISQAMVDLSTRFAMFNSQYPQVSYRRLNLDTEPLNASEKFDTAFMFSIHDHLKDPSVLLSIAKNNVKKFVIFEGHPGGQYVNYTSFLDSGIFKSVSEIGRLHTSRFKKDSSRILWLCEK